ncbi:hypothetical protein K501DRAFT_262771 [Backusella circina FSU 941]|nr:hypothetical protein K501DRAFT_262771 [Backusella circina FSU 941]
MKFSLAAASVFALTVLSSAVKADSYSDAMEKFCGGLAVTAPTETDVFVAGQNATITVTRQPNDQTKTITGLDLYVVQASGDPKYVQNVWAGSYELNTQASLSDAIPSNVTAGNYYYRVWVTNMINGQHGPDCLETSKTFQVTTGSHTNDAGETSYDQALDDESIFNSAHRKGCFGLKVDSPKEGATEKQDSHTSVVLNRDSAAQRLTLKKVDLYKVSDSGNELVESIWEGSERLSNVFTLKDHIKLPTDKFDASANYQYLVEVTSDLQGETCSFQSGAFKISA